MKNLDYEVHCQHARSQICSNSTPIPPEQQQDYTELHVWTQLIAHQSYHSLLTGVLPRLWFLMKALKAGPPAITGGAGLSMLDNFHIL